ncbi:MAG TPA: type I phosphomannose isomerase catalytic subunit [Terriglobia bacterium]|nr:type I phosphomannose isomerase catalytic subunit [Terriglobia bacterium]
MPALDQPLLLVPALKEKIWGREQLDPLYNGAGNGGEPGRSPSPHPAKAAARPARRIGEAWLTGDEARFMTGPVAGLTLGEVFARSPVELCGRNWNADYFPFLAKFLFTSDWLSMQVHPDDDYALRHESSRGKTEAWYVITSDDNAEIALGVHTGTTRQALESACRQGRSRELAVSFSPKPAEGVFVPSGSLHALGPGLVIFELSETSDVTYRLDDYGRLDKRRRPRPLHLERGLETVRLEAPGYRDLPRLEFKEDFGSRRYVVACRYFAIEVLSLEDRCSFAAPEDRVEGLAVIRGEGRVETSRGWLAYATGQSWLIPPGAEPCRLVPEEDSTLIRFYVPDLDRDFRRPLAKLGVAPDLIRKVVFEN